MKMKTFVFRVFPVAFTSLLPKTEQQSLKVKYSAFFDINNNAVLTNNENYSNFLEDVLDELEDSLDEQANPVLDIELATTILAIRNVASEYKPNDGKKITDEGVETIDNKKIDESAKSNETITDEGVKAIEAFFTITNYDDQYANPSSPAKLLRYIIAREYSKHIAPIAPMDLLYKSKSDLYRKNEPSSDISKEAQELKKALLKIPHRPDKKELNRHHSKQKTKSYAENCDELYDDIIVKAQLVGTIIEDKKIDTTVNLQLLKANLLSYLFFDEEHLIELLDDSEDENDVRKRAQITNADAIRVYLAQSTEKNEHEKRLAKLAAQLKNRSHIVEYLSAIEKDNVANEYTIIVNHIDLKIIFPNLKAIESFVDKMDTDLHVGTLALLDMHSKLLKRIVDSKLTDHYCKNINELTTFMSMLSKIYIGDDSSTIDFDTEGKQVEKPASVATSERVSRDGLLSTILYNEWKDIYLPKPKQLAEYLEDAPSRNRLAELGEFINAFGFKKIFPDKKSLTEYLETISSEYRLTEKKYLLANLPMDDSVQNYFDGFDDFVAYLTLFDDQTRIQKFAQIVKVCPSASDKLMTNRNDLFKYLAMLSREHWPMFIETLGAKQFFDLMLGKNDISSRYEKARAAYLTNKSTGTIPVILEDVRNAWIKLRDDKEIYYKKDENKNLLNDIVLYCLYELYSKMTDMNIEHNKMIDEIQSNLSKQSSSLLNVPTNLVASGLSLMGAGKYAAKIGSDMPLIKKRICDARKAHLILAPDRDFMDFVHKAYQPLLTDFKLMGPAAEIDRAKTKNQICELDTDRELGVLAVTKRREELASGAFFQNVVRMPNKPMPTMRKVETV